MNRFWSWYEKNLKTHTIVSAVLFSWQLVHLFWLTTDVVSPRLGFVSFFPASGFWEFVIILVDYTEIPAIFSVSLLYINELRKGFSSPPVWMLLLLNSQWLHIFWITDEFVVDAIGSMGTIFPLWLAWVAILIDYLELPVMYDTLKRALAFNGRKLN